jgi:hypothetical protein
MIVQVQSAQAADRITALPWTQVPVTATDDAHGHGRVKRRTLKVLTTARHRIPYAKQLIQITRERVTAATGERTREIVYAICSLPFEHARPAMIAAWLRDHTEPTTTPSPRRHPDHRSDTPTTRPRPKPFKPRAISHPNQPHRQPRDHEQDR